MGRPWALSSVFGGRAMQEERVKQKDALPTADRPESPAEETGIL